MSNKSVRFFAGGGEVESVFGVDKLATALTRCTKAKRETKLYE